MGHKGAVWSSRLSMDGAKAVTGGGDFTAFVPRLFSLRRAAANATPCRKVWDTVSGACLTTLPHNHIVRTVDLSANASRVLSGGNEKKLRLWDLGRAPVDGREASTVDGVEEFRNGAEGCAHAGTVRSACWDERRGSVVSMGEDRVVRYVFLLSCFLGEELMRCRWWDLRTLQPTHSITFSSPITSMEKSHDGELLSITSGNDVTFLSLDSCVSLPHLLSRTLTRTQTTSLPHPPAVVRT